MQKKIVGVLGGMGPDATVDFMSKVIANCNAINIKNNAVGADQDHIRMLIDHNPKVPNRNDAIKGIGEDVGSHLADMAKRLENADADFLVMVVIPHMLLKRISNKQYKYLSLVLSMKSRLN